MFPESSQQRCEKLVDSEQSTFETEGDTLVFTACEYESEDDASEDDGEELTRMLLTKKRDILVQGLKVLHMATLNLQSDFFVHWRSQTASHRDALDIRIQEPHVVLTEAMPERLSALWPDLDLDSYRAGTNMSCKAFQSL